MLPIPRFLEGAVRRAVRTFPAVLVTGARQTGKTTMLRRMFGTHDFVSMERLDVRERALADPIAFFEGRKRIVLDEIQYAPALLHHVKELIDDKRIAGRFLLSGSQTLSLMKEVTQTLAGRVAVLTLDPLSASETTKGSARSIARTLRAAFGARGRAPSGPTLEKWLLRGGFPEPALRPRVDRELWFAGYVQTYLERDVRDLLRVGDLRAFGRFVGLVAARTGGLLNLADLGRDAGVSAPTAAQWLSVLEASGLVFLLRPFHANLGKRLVKSPKLYVMDSALAAFMMGLHSFEAISHGPSFGALMETVVVTEWVKAFRQQGLPPALTFWRSSDGHEVDVVIEHDAKIYGVEVKATATPTPRHAESLAKWMALSGASHGVLACMVAKATPLRPGIRAVPWRV